MATCKKAYGQQSYGTSPYGTGEYDGVQPRNIVLYYPSVSGDINMSAPISFVPKPTVDLSAVARIRTLTPAGEHFFSDIHKLPIGGVYISYHKLWIHNACEIADFTDVEFAIDPAVDPDGWMSIAPVSVGIPLPLDGNERNTDGGDGPGTWQTTPLAFDRIPSFGAVALWLRRKVVNTIEEQQYVPVRFLITGNTTASGIVCPA